MTEQVPDTITAVAEYNATASALANLRQRFAGVLFDVTTREGMEHAKEARRELRTLRVDLEKKRIEIKAPALERCRLIDSEAKRITAELAGLEEPIDSQIKKFEAAKERERQEREERERARVARIRDNVARLQRWPLAALNRSSTEIEELITDLVAEAITAETYFEFAEEAEIARADALAQLRAQFTAKQAHEAEAAELARRRAEQDRIEAEARARREEEERQREAHRKEHERIEREAREQREREETESRRQRDEQDRLAREAREREERASRERIAEQERVAREEREAQEADARRSREAEEKRLRDERERIDRENAELRRRQEAAAEEERKRQEEIARAERERQEREQRETAEREANERREQALLSAKRPTIQKALAQVLFVARNVTDYTDSEARAEIGLICEANLEGDALVVDAEFECETDRPGLNA